MPKNNKTKINIIDDDEIVEEQPNNNQPEVDEEVIVASEYHEQKQHEEEPVFDDEDELFDYAKNMGKNIFEQDKAKAIEDVRKDGRPFDLDYQEKGVPIMPVPATITKGPNGKETFNPLPPWEINNADPKTTAVVYCTPEGKPLYEDDKKTLKIAKSSDSEFRSVYDDEAPEPIKEMNKLIKDITLKHEAAINKTKKPIRIVVDKNLQTILLIHKFCKIEIVPFIEHVGTEKDKKTWNNLVKNETIKALLIHYQIPVPQDKEKLNKLIKTMEAGIKRKAFDLKNIKIDQPKSR